MKIPDDAKELMEQKKVIALAIASGDAVPNVVYMMLPATKTQES